MNDRERVSAILHYESYDRMPLVHFGFWEETLDKWVNEGHLTADERDHHMANRWNDRELPRKLGFDITWHSFFAPASHLWPGFGEQLLEEAPDGTRKLRNNDGVVVVVRPGAHGIPAEVDHLLKGRSEWEQHFKHRFQFTPERVAVASVLTPAGFLRYDAGGMEALRSVDRDFPYGLMCGSLLGTIRNMLGFFGVNYLFAEDEETFDDIINTVGELSYRCVEAVLGAEANFDFAHFWEDIAYNNGPVVIPDVFHDKVGPHYRRITNLLKSHGVDIVSVDSDSCIDSLIPTWLENGVNTMFPIEVGTWGGNIAPWRAQYGRDLRGGVGMDKRVFARDRAAVDAEIERLRPLVDLGGYIPCPDHLIPPDAKFELVQYYCAKMRDVF
jgi:hypothetical protein